MRLDHADQQTSTMYMYYPWAMAEQTPTHHSSVCDVEECLKTDKFLDMLTRVQSLVLALAAYCLS